MLPRAQTGAPCHMCSPWTWLAICRATPRTKCPPQASSNSAEEISFKANWGSPRSKGAHIPSVSAGVVEDDAEDCAAALRDIAGSVPHGVSAVPATSEDWPVPYREHDPL